MVDYIDIIKNSILLYNHKWRSIAIPVYLTAFISLLSVGISMFKIVEIQIISYFVFSLFSLTLIFVAFTLIMPALEKRKLPQKITDKGVLKTSFFKAFKFYFIELTSIIILMLFTIGPFVLIGYLIFNFWNAGNELIFLVLLFITVIALILLLILMILLGFVFGFAQLEYVLNKKSLFDSIKEGLNLLKSKFIDVILFNLLLWFVIFILFIPMYIFQIILVGALIFAMYSLPTELLIAINFISMIVSSVYNVVLIMPWYYIAKVDFWRRLTDEKNNNV